MPKGRKWKLVQEPGKLPAWVEKGGAVLTKTPSGSYHVIEPFKKHLTSSTKFKRMMLGKGYKFRVEFAKGTISGAKITYGKRFGKAKFFKTPEAIRKYMDLHNVLAKKMTFLEKPLTRF
jgi:hypothetical protein